MQQLTSNLSPLWWGEMFPVKDDCFVANDSLTFTSEILMYSRTEDSVCQGVFFPAGVRVFPAGNLQNPQEILTKN